MASAKFIALFHLSVLLLTSFTALAFNEDVSFAQAPHYTDNPTHPPVAAPKPGHHQKGGHHHHHPKPPTQPPSNPTPKTPTPTPPAKPPTPPTKAPTPPTKAPTPPTKAPTPPTKAPTPPTKPPTPPTKAPTPPTKAPSPPTKAPTPPTKAPTLPPKYPPMPPMVKKLVAIQGVVYCKACKYTGFDTLTGATALANATVKLVCYSGKYHMVHQATTDKNGYFYMMPQKLTTSGIGICKVVLAKSPSAKCSVPTNLHNGLKGALLVPPPPTKTPTPPSKFALFTVGPFAYEATKKCY
ncbi:hypothetical protein Leryth_023595 [Lithospermum erythrorhizon]|nr:hypothetical protein Leryth_023595 [Lithospermum erythrorhizon]